MHMVAFPAAIMRMIAQVLIARVLCTWKQLIPLHKVTFLIGTAGRMVSSIGSKLADYIQEASTVDCIVVS